METTTFFLPAETASYESLQHHVNLIQSTKLLGLMADAVPHQIMILNPERQVIFANQSVLNYLNLEDASSLIGLRPGEALNCQYANEHLGCGTTEFCKVCGAAKALQYCSQGKEDCQECRITQNGGIGYLDLRVWVTPFELEEKSLTIFVVTDIQHEKRREALEQIFFHDVLNTAGAIENFAGFLKSGKPEKREKYIDKLELSSQRLINEINTQKVLLAAEKGILKVVPTVTSSINVLNEMVYLYQDHVLAQNRPIKLADNAQNINLMVDSVLLRRIISNMVKNALEASKTGESVTLGCDNNGESVCFWVHNQKFIERNDQMQIFQRSFSTKGGNRGLGTYSIKLLTEHYMEGQAAFTSSPEDGTIFKVIYPVNFSTPYDS